MKKINFKPVVLALSITVFGALNANATTSVYTYNQPATVGNVASFSGQQMAGNRFDLRGFDDRARFASRSGFDRHSLGESKHWNSWGGSGGSVVVPVPEAKTYSMMLVGLGLMCLIAYRRRMDSR